MAHEQKQAPRSGAAQAGRRVPERTCAGCREVAPAGDLLRLSHLEGHEPPVVPDLSGKLGGRGVWLHPRRACVQTAVRRGGLSRSLRAPVQLDLGELLAGLVAQLEARERGLLLAAVRKRATSLGTDASRQALTTGAACLLVVANDAAGRRDELRALAERRRCPVLERFDKRSLGRLAGRETLGIMAITDAGIASEIGSCARQLAGLAEGE